ncbi:MAG: restriction endonuclease, partial [Prevotellaceae bacterium]|nr:restriction endonuclease [Prevotellaceae bacterium]
VFVDDNNRKTICRFYFNSPTNKRITFFDENKKENHNKISSIDDIYNYAEQLIKTVEKYK